MSAAPHIPVLLDEVLDALAIAPGEIHVDGTFGAGSYSSAMAQAGVVELAHQFPGEGIIRDLVVRPTREIEVMVMTEFGLVLHIAGIHGQVV